MTPAPADFEKDWLLQAADGDRHAFTDLYTRYLDSLYQYVFLFTRSAYSTEEIVQDVFVRIWEHRQRLREVESFKSYLFRAAKNRVIDYVRSDEVEERALSRLLAEQKAGPETPDEAFDYKAYYHIVQEAIGQLSPRKQEIFRLSTEKEPFARRDRRGTGYLQILGQETSYTNPSTLSGNTWPGREDFPLF